MSAFLERPVFSRHTQAWFRLVALKLPTKEASGSVLPEDHTSGRKKATTQARSSDGIKYRNISTLSVNREIRTKVTTGKLTAISKANGEDTGEREVSGHWWVMYHGPALGK